MLARCDSIALRTAPDREADTPHQIGSIWSERALARIEAVVRRSKRPSKSIVRTGGLSVDLDTRTAALDGRPLNLTRSEYEILELLSLRKGNTLTKEMILSHLYGGKDEPGIKIIDVFVCKLRNKLLSRGGKSYIETAWGCGYLLRDPESVGPVDAVVETTTPHGSSFVQAVAITDETKRS